MHVKLLENILTVGKMRKMLCNKLEVLDQRNKFLRIYFIKIDFSKWFYSHQRNISNSNDFTKFHIFKEKILYKNEGTYFLILCSSFKPNTQTIPEQNEKGFEKHQFHSK
jgi:hypothetical protein